MCFLNSRQNSEKKEKSKENDVQEEDINDSEEGYLKGLSISKIQDPKQKNEISIKYLGLFILSQIYKVIIFVMFLFFISILPDMCFIAALLQKARCRFPRQFYTPIPS